MSSVFIVYLFDIREITVLSKNYIFSFDVNNDGFWRKSRSEYSIINIISQLFWNIACMIEQILLPIMFESNCFIIRDQGEFLTITDCKTLESTHNESPQQVTELVDSRMAS